MIQDIHPEQVRELHPDESFHFRCHAGLECFTDCCRQLELALTPYDVLRLTKNLALSADEFLNTYCVIEQEEGEAFPKVYLGMNNDEQGTCPFVRKDGCLVYGDRPGACRAYPIGRAAFRTPDNIFHDFHVLLSEPHCKGFSQAACQTAGQWTLDQGLREYNTINDETMVIVHHEKAKQSSFNKDQLDAFMLGLYRLDVFRQYVLSPDFKGNTPPSSREAEEIGADDTALLRFGIKWLKKELYDE